MKHAQNMFDNHRMKIYYFLFLFCYTHMYIRMSLFSLCVYRVNYNSNIIFCLRRADWHFNKFSLALHYV